MQRTRISNILDEFLDSFVEYPVYYVTMPNVRSDIRKTADSIELDLPGFEKDQIAITAKSGYILVEAVSDERKVTKMFSMKSGLDPENITAQYRNGVLKILLPESSKVEKKIKIE